MTPTEVEDRFEQAAATLRRLPAVRVPGYFSTWPPVVRNIHEAFGWEPARFARIPPTADAIARMEETFTWLAWLDGDDARIVWLRAEGVRWKPICWRIGISRATAWRRWAAALITVANRLSAPPKQTKPKGAAKTITADRRNDRREGVA
jgi:hypothetical protein